ncbi:MAG TPA: hypothetical protein PLO48_13505, partial [Saprospiraceae bacterium]|nr:hypothetical protein [Saprospiraceae bacterium]
MNLRFILIFCLLALTTFISGQSWNQISADEIEDKGIKDIEPQIFTLYNIDDTVIKDLLWSAKHESEQDVKQSNVVIQVGLPENRIENFKIVQYDMMEPELASKYHEIRTFYGVSAENSAKRIRIDYTNHGFRAVISSPDEDKVFIDHFQRNDKNTRVVYYKKDYKKVPTWGCNVTEEHIIDRNIGSGSRIGDCQLRSYRLAQATTAEYSIYHGATSAAQSSLVMTAVVNVINRINEVYEPEVAVR